MKNKDILLLEQELPRISVPDMDRWFNYAISETFQRAEAEAINVKAVIKPKDGMKEYQDKLKKLQIEHSEKDEYGEPVTTVTPMPGGKQFEQYEIPEINNPKSKFNIAVDELKAEYQEDIDKYDETLKFLDEENANFEPFWIKFEQVPKGLNRLQMDVVMMILDKGSVKEKK